MNNLLFNLPQEIIGKIYSQDNTYVDIFTNKVLNNIYDYAVDFWKMKHFRKHGKNEKFNCFLDYLIQSYSQDGKGFYEIDEISLLSNDGTLICAKINDGVFDGGIYNLEEFRAKNHEYTNPNVNEIWVYSGKYEILEFLR
jgi:hypothetical protein